MAKPTRDQLIDMSRTVAARYNGNLTVRQLYYRLVAAGEIQSSQREYKRIVSALSVARLDGRFPFEWLLDRTREARPGRFTENSVDVDEALKEAAEHVRSLPGIIRRDRWYGQREFVSVWVEKEALAGVFEHPCQVLGVSWFVCRGYSSLSSLYEWCKHAALAKRMNDSIEQCTILYFGDHDPDGWEIPRSALRNLRDIIAIEGLDVPPIRMSRVALNRDQIDAFNPPPFPAKMTSARYQGYVDEHDTDLAWELDALDPDELDRLIRKEVAARFDNDRHAEMQSLVFTRRDQMRHEMKTDDWLEYALEDV